MSPQPIAPDTPGSPPPPPQLENWFRPLKDDRLEVCLKAKGVRLRASGTSPEVWKLVELFETLTGAEITADWKRPPRTGSRPLDGQLTIGLESGPDGEE